jgi:hypothetical protein
LNAVTDSETQPPADLPEAGAPALQDEAAYCQAWQQAGLAARPPAQAAFEGGLLADRPAWVFVAGYQAAIRTVFPEVECPGWLAFAVTEDRSDPDSALVAQADDAEWQLTGRKSWVAAVNQVEELIVSARCRGRTELFRLAADIKGVTLNAREAPGFLGTMSQGRALFEAAPAARLDGPGRRRLFAGAEAVAMMLAATGYARRHSTAASADALGQLEALAPALNDALATVDELDPEQLLALDVRWHHAFEAWEQAADSRALPDYSADERLFRLYRGAIAKRTEAARITVAEPKDER